MLHSVTVIAHAMCMSSNVLLGGWLSRWFVLISMISMLMACDADPRKPRGSGKDPAPNVRLAGISTREVDIRLDRRFETAVGIRKGEVWPDKRFNCTGTLISPQWVLTADHCVIEATALTITVPNTETREDGVEIRSTSGTSTQRIEADFAKGLIESDEERSLDGKLSALADLALIHLSEPASGFDEGYMFPMLPRLVFDADSSLTSTNSAGIIADLVQRSGVNDIQPRFASAGFGKVDKGINDQFRFTRNQTWFFEPGLRDVFSLVPVVSKNDGDPVSFCGGDSGAPVMMQDSTVPILLGIFVQNWFRQTIDVVPPCGELFDSGVVGDAIDLSQYIPWLLRTISDYECATLSNSSTVINVARGEDDDFKQLILGQNQQLTDQFEIENYRPLDRCNTGVFAITISSESLAPYVLPRENVPESTGDFVRREANDGRTVYSYYRPQHRLERRQNCQLSEPLPLWTSYIDGLKREKMQVGVNEVEVVGGSVGDVDQIIRGDQPTNWYALCETYGTTVDEKDRLRIGYIHDLTGDRIACD